MTFYSDMRAVALNLLTDYGQSAAWRVVTSTYDPTTGEAVLATTDTTVTVVKLPLPREYNEFTRNLVEMSEHLIVMSATELETAGVVPSSNDKFVLGGIVYEVIALKAIDPGGTVVAYKLLVTK